MWYWIIGILLLLIVGYIVYVAYADRISLTGSTVNIEDENTDSNSDANTIPEENNVERYATITIIDDNISA